MALTISGKLEETNGRPAGFDYMRVGLALMILVWHSCVTDYGWDAQTALATGPTRPIWALLLPMFFALSGFLVAGSLERSRTLLGFLGLRAIRLLPALAVESTLSVLVLGSVFTTLTLGEYFSAHATWRYLGNLVGAIDVYLPGVFKTNPTDAVNGQLWTLPYEMRCYIELAVIALIGGYRIRPLLLFLVAVLQAYTCFKTWHHPPHDAGIVNGRILILCFIWGVTVYRFRDHIPLTKWLFAASLVLSVLLLSTYKTLCLAPLPVAYMTVWLGMTHPPRNALVSSGDYSYGIFLYGFPIQQAIAAAFPAHRVWWFNLMLAIPATTLVAFLSWHAVEKPALKFRFGLAKLEARWLPHATRASAFFTRLMPAPLRSRWAPSSERL